MSNDQLNAIPCTPAICFAMPAERAYDHDPSRLPEPEAVQREQLEKVIRLADHLLAGKRFYSNGLAYTQDDISVRLCEHKLFRSIIANVALHKEDAEVVAKDLMIRCARQVAADALDIDLWEIA